MVNLKVVRDGGLAEQLHSFNSKKTDVITVNRENNTLDEHVRAKEAKTSKKNTINLIWKTHGKLPNK